MQFMMWGTDCHDDPITNARHLERAMRGSEVAWDWAALQKERSRGQGGGNLLALFQKQTEKQQRTAEEGNAEAADDGEEEGKEGRTPGEEEKEAAATSTDAAAHQKRPLKESGDAGEPSAKKVKLQPSPSRGANTKMTAKDRQAKTAKGNISSFFTSTAPR